MSSFVWMKVLESAPERYDRGVRMLSRGRIDGVRAAVAGLAVRRGRRVLDIGCGTGALTLACLERDADVIAIDRSPGMLDVARQRPLPKGARVRWIEASAAEIEDHVPPASLDAVVSCLAFSEMDPPEQDYALRAAFSRLVPKGVLFVCDEVVPRSRTRRALSRALRAPLVALTYALTQTTTRPVEHLPERIAAAGFKHVAEERIWGDTFAVVQGLKPEDAFHVPPLEPDT